MSRLFIKLSMLVLIFVIALPAIAGEGRTPIHRAGTTINTSGKYIVTRNLVNAAATPGPVITIAAPDVDLDLNGFVLDNTAHPGLGNNVIDVWSGLMTVRIHNGELVGGFRGVQVLEVKKVVIEDLRINDTSDSGIYLNEVNSFAIRRNVIVKANEPGIQVNFLTEGTTGTIEDNVIRYCKGGILVFSGYSVGILNNRIESTTDPVTLPAAGIYLESCKACLVSQNTINNSAEEGIKLFFSSGNKLYNNVIKESAKDGIHIDQGSGDNLILNNVSTNNTQDGLRVEGSYNHIDRNVLNSNGNIGLNFLNPADFNTFGRNTARGSGSGADFSNWPGALSNDSFGDNLMPGPPPG